MDNTNENSIESTKAKGSGRKRKIEEIGDDFIDTVETCIIKTEEDIDEDPIENYEEDYMASFLVIKRKLDEIIKDLRANIESSDIRWRETGDLSRDCINNFKVDEFNINVDENLNEKCEDKMQADKLIKTETTRRLNEDEGNKNLSCSNIIETDASLTNLIECKVEQEWNVVLGEYCEEQHSLADSLVQEFLDLLDDIKGETTDNEDKGSSIFGLQFYEISMGSMETLKNVGLEEAPKNTPQNEMTTDNSVESKDSSIVRLESHETSNDAAEPEEASNDSSPNEKTIDDSVVSKETSKDPMEDVQYKKSHKSGKKKSEDLTPHKDSKCSRKSDKSSSSCLVGDKQTEYDKSKTESNKSPRESKKSNKRKSSYEPEIESSKIPKTAEFKRSPKDPNDVKNMDKKQNDEPELSKIQELFLSPIRNVVIEKAPSRVEEEPETEIGIQQNVIADVKSTAEDIRLSEKIYKPQTESLGNDNKEKPASSAAQAIVSSPYPRNAIRQLREIAINKGSSDAQLPGYTYGELTTRELVKRHKFSENSFEDLEDNEMAWCFTHKSPSSNTPKNELRKRKVCFAPDTNVVPETSARPTTSKSNEANATELTKPIGPQTIPKVGERKKKRRRSRNKNSQTEAIPSNIQNQPSCSGYQSKKKNKKSNEPPNRGLDRPPNQVRAPNAQVPVTAQSKKKSKKNKTNGDYKLNALARKLLDTITEVNNGKRIAIVPSQYPQTKLTASQADLITEEICRMLDQIPYGSEVPCFEHTRYIEGVLWIQCTNTYATKWLVGSVPCVKPWPGASLRIWRNDDKNNSNSNKIPKLKKMCISIPGTSVTTNEILQRLERQNRGLRTQLWVVYSRNDSDHHVQLTVGMDNASHRQIKEMDNLAYVGLGKAFFKDVL